MTSEESCIYIKNLGNTVLALAKRFDEIPEGEPRKILLRIKEGLLRKVTLPINFDRTDVLYAIQNYQSQKDPLNSTNPRLHLLGEYLSLPENLENCESIRLKYARWSVINEALKKMFVERLLQDNNGNISSTKIKQMIYIVREGGTFVLTQSDRPVLFHPSLGNGVHVFNSSEEYDHGLEKICRNPVTEGNPKKINTSLVLSDFL